MKKLILSTLGVLFLSQIAMAEPQVTNVTPENANDGNVKFSLEIPEPEGARLITVRLQVDLRSKRYEETEPPSLYLRKGERTIGVVALHANSDLDGFRIYSCQLDRDYLMDSTISVIARPAESDELLEVGAQSMEYIIDLKSFAGELASSNQAK